MKDADSLKNAIFEFVEEYLGEVTIDREADLGAISLLVEQGKIALQSDDQGKVDELLIETAKVAMGVGVRRGRFDMAKTIFEIVERWHNESN